tara:strand:+ start:17584 stop:18051 length:468 start_codon:yes stop_codon:yes gene_type:complete
MTFTTSAGTSIALSAGPPATFDAAGYAALTFTAIGEVTDLGEIPSRVYELVTHQPIASRGLQKGKGGYQLGSQSITFAIDADDAGQLLVDAATNSDDGYSIKIAHPTLGTIYARALVMGGAKSYGDVNSVATRTVTLEYTMASATEDGIVAVPAA